MQAKQRKSPSFEQALEELERIVERMEEGELSLEESLQAFERGMELSRTCQKSLEEAEQRIQILMERDGKLEAAHFETNDDQEER